MTSMATARMITHDRMGIAVAPNTVIGKHGSTRIKRVVAGGNLCVVWSGLQTPLHPGERGGGDAGTAARDNALRFGEQRALVVGSHHRRANQRNRRAAAGEEFVVKRLPGFP